MDLIIAQGELDKVCTFKNGATTFASSRGRLNGSTISKSMPSVGGRIFYIQEYELITDVQVAHETSLTLSSTITINSIVYLIKSFRKFFEKRFWYRFTLLITGQVIPSTVATTLVTTGDYYPIFINSGDFEVDGTSYNNANILGDDLAIFINEYSQQWLFAPGSFVYTATGIQVVITGFNATVDTYNIIIIKINM